MFMGTAMLSTTDNPFDPFEDYISWHLYDERLDHNCASLLAMYADISDDMTDEEVSEAINSAIDTIVATDETGLFIKVQPKD